MKKITLRSVEIRKLLDVPSLDLPTYVSPLLNLANRFAGATRPRIVGQLSEMIHQFGGRTLEEWSRWYQRQYPNTIEEATKLILQKVQEFQQVLNQIDDVTVRRWVEDLVLVKTFIGLRFQEAILKKIATETGKSYTLANAEQEAAGIDGIIGNRPISIKPISWKEQQVHREQLQGAVVFYRKTDDAIEIEFDPNDFSDA
ncbi:MAG: MjaI family restriction endonuclease [Chlorobi bacterium]|nr:MjaI family restriction endonuclease [Chlorobiota bacterium]